MLPIQYPAHHRMVSAGKMPRWKIKQCHLLPGCMAGYVPDWSQDCTVFEHQDKATVAAAEAIGATVLQLLPSSQSEPRHLPCCHHHSPREREAALVLPVSTAISILAAQLLIQTSLLSRVWVVPVIPYFRSWGEETEL